jgi:anti-sigma B factor antagonist
MGAPEGFEVNEQESADGVVLAVAGELDIQTVVELESRVDEVLRRGIERLVLDLAELAFMDSSGLRFLLVVDQRARREGWTLSLVPPRHDAANLVLRMTGADSSLPFDGGATP